MRRTLPLLILAALSAAACGGIVERELPSGSGAGGGASAGAGGSSLACDPGLADCNGALDDGCEVDLTSDASSCGACGHGCQGGPCQSGLCQAFVVMSGQGYAYRIAVNEEHVYWTRGADGVVMRAPSEGGPAEIVAEGQSSPTDIALSGGAAVWSNAGDGSIWRAPFAGGAPALITSGQGQPWSIAVTGSTVVWCDNKTGEVRSVPEAGGPVHFLGSTPGSWSVAADEESVFWVRVGWGDAWRASLASGEPAVVTASVTSPNELALSGDRVFLATINGLVVVPKAGGEAKTLDPDGAYGVAVDGDHVYFGAYDGRVLRAPLGGGPPEVLAKGPFTPTDIAVNSTSVFWTAAAQKGLILKVAK